MVGVAVSVSVGVGADVSTGGVWTMCSVVAGSIPSSSVPQPLTTVIDSANMSACLFILFLKCLPVIWMSLF